jgi:hypothetical protein
VTGLYVAFGVLKVQEHAAEARRAQRALSRRERLKRWILSVAVVGLLAWALSREPDAHVFSRAMTILFLVSILWAIIDITRGPSE